MSATRHQAPENRPPKAAFRNAWFLAGIGILLLAWWIISHRTGPLLLASPVETARTLVRLTLNGSLVSECGITITRIALIMILASTIAGVMGLLAVQDRRLAGLFEPWRRLCSTIPPVVLVLVVMFWMGLGSRMIVTFGVLILWPIMYINIIESAVNYTKELKETATVFRLSLYMRARHFFLPAIMPGCMAAAVQMICSAIRVVVLAEALGAERGIGAAIVMSSRNLAIDQMTAWVLVTLLLAFLAEFALLAPLRRSVYRWKTA